MDCGDTIAHCLAFDKNTKTLVVGCSDAEIKVINVEKQQITNQLKGHDDAINAIYVDQENKYVFSASNDGTVRTWK